MQKTTFLVLGEAFGFEWRDNVLQETEATGVGEAFSLCGGSDWWTCE